MTQTRCQEAQQEYLIIFGYAGSGVPQELLAFAFIEAEGCRFWDSACRYDVACRRLR